MTPFVHIIIGLMVTGFWAGVVSFIPATLYLLFINPYLVKCRRLYTSGILVIGGKTEFRAAQKKRVRMLSLIYGICFGLVGAAYLYKWLQFRQTDLSPFNFLFAATLVHFFASVLSYAPLAVYLNYKYPRRREEDGLCLEGGYIFCGVCVLAFCVFYAWYWLKTHGLLASGLDMSASFGIIFLTSMVLAYLPVLVYVLSRVKNPRRQEPLHPNVVFIIYSICFCLSALVYVIQWLK